MEKVLLPLAAAAAIAAAATPAAAHPGNVQPRMNLQRQIDQREAQIDRLIDVAARRGQISTFDARRLNTELRNIKVIERRYRSHGLTAREYADLNARLDRLQFNLQIARRDDNRRYGYGYGYDWRW